MRPLHLVNSRGAGTSPRFVRTSFYWPIIHIEAPLCRPIGYRKSSIRMLGRGREDVVSVKAYRLAMQSVCFLLLAATSGRTQVAPSFSAGASYNIAFAQHEERPIPPMPIPYVARSRSTFSAPLPRPRSAPLPRPRPSEFAPPKTADVPRGKISAAGSTENSGSLSNSGTYHSPAPTAPASPRNLPPPPPIND